MDSDDSDESRTCRMEISRHTYLIRRDPQRSRMNPMIYRDRNEMVFKQNPRYISQINSDDEEYSASIQGRDSPPMTATFKRSDRDARPIRQLLEPPWRQMRPKKICIFIRGPLFSGKSYISKWIMEKEAMYGNKVECINGINPSHYLRGGPSLLYEQLENAGKSDCKFLIVEIKSHKNRVFENCIRIVRKFDYELYGIDIIFDTNSKIFQSKKREINMYPYERLTNLYIDEMKSFPMPYYITMLNPIEIFPNKFKMTLFMNCIGDGTKNNNYGIPDTCVDDFSVVDDAYYDIATVKDIYKYFSSSIQYSSNFEDDLIDKVSDMIVNKTQEPYKSVIDHHLLKVPSYKPVKVIEYDHHIEIIDDSKILEVNPSLIHDYNHYSKQYLLDMLGDIDVEEIIERKKAEKLEEKVKFYKQYEKHKGVQISVYPNNWERIDIERPVANGKRKKIKTAKIVKILDQKSIKTVQKGVKRMEIDSQEQEDQMIDIDDEVTKPYHIDEIIKKTSIDSLKEVDNKDAFDYIRTFYMRLDTIPEMSIILQIVAQVDNLKIQFSMNDGESCCFNPMTNLIKIFVGDLNETDLLRTLGHQLMHCAVHWIYKNNAKPYAEDDNYSKDELRRIFIATNIIENEEHDDYRMMLDQHCESDYNAEIAGIFGEMIVDGSIEELRNIADLWEYYKKMMLEIESFGKRFKLSSMRGVY